MFPSATGRPMDPDNLGRHFRALCDRAGIGRVRLHDLRHTCASLLLAQNVYPASSWRSSATPASRSPWTPAYSHVLPELQREAADRMDQALGYTTDDEGQDPPEPELGIDGA